MDRRTNGWTDGPTNKAGCRVAQQAILVVMFSQEVYWQVTNDHSNIREMQEYYPGLGYNVMYLFALLIKQTHVNEQLEVATV